MKHKFACLFASALLSVTLTGCDLFNFEREEIRKVDGVVIDITHSESDYAVGEKLFDHFECWVEKRYSDGSRVILSGDEYEWILFRNNQRYDVREPFVDIGTYQLRARYIEPNLISEPYTFQVHANHLYAKNLNPTGPRTMGLYDTIQIEIKTDPANYSGNISFNYTATSMATVKKTGTKTFEITSKKNGGFSVTFFALKDEINYISVEYNIYIQNAIKIPMSKTYSNLLVYNEDRPYLPTSGNIKMLVIPIWFTNSGNFIDLDKSLLVKQHIYDCFFGATLENGIHSVKTYYEQESFGALSIDGKVSPWFNCQHSTSQFASGEYTRPALMKDAVNWYFSTSGESRKSYDLDGDGYLDIVEFVYAAPDYKCFSYSNNETLFWGYQSHLGDSSLKNLNSPGLNLFTFQSYDFMYSTDDALLWTGHNYSVNSSQYSPNPFVFIHETGHTFGVPDLYDYAHHSFFSGHFNMQDDNQGGHDPFSVMALNWNVRPYIPTQSCTITINDFQSTHDLILLTPEWNDYDSVFDEYLLLELFTNTGLNYFDIYDTFDEGYEPAPGIRLWHINAKLIDYYDDVFTTYPNKYTKIAFNNSSEITNGGRECNAYYLNSDFQKYAFIHGIGNVKFANYISCSDTYYHSFRAGDSFSMNERNFKQQFVRYYLRKEQLEAPYETDEYWDDEEQDYVIPSEEKQAILAELDQYDKLDFGQQLGWEFTVQSITHNGGDSYSATIRLTKTA